MSAGRWLMVGAVALMMAAFAACEVDPGDVLDGARVLAVRADPPTRVAERETVVTALVFEADTPVTWRACSTFWTPDDPVSCASGETSLGDGNPITLAAEAEPTDIWLLAEVDGAFPAVRKLATEGSDANPEVLGLTAADGGVLPVSVASDADLDMIPLYGANQDTSELVVTWYTTGGEIEPARTVGSDVVTLTAPAEPGSVTVIGVVRDQGGGVSWTEATVSVGGAP